MVAAQEVLSGSYQGDRRNWYGTAKSRVKQGKTEKINFTRCCHYVERVIPGVGRTGMPAK